MLVFPPFLRYSSISISESVSCYMFGSNTIWIWSFSSMGSRYLWPLPFKCTMLSPVGFIYRLLSALCTILNFVLLNPDCWFPCMFGDRVALFLICVRVSAWMEVWCISFLFSTCPCEISYVYSLFVLFNELNSDFRWGRRGNGQSFVPGDMVR